MDSSHNKLYKTLLESFSDFNITEEDKKDKPTKTKDKPKVDDIFKQKPDQPVVPKDEKKDDVKGGDKDNDKTQSPSFKRSSQGDTLRKTSNITPSDQMRDMLSRMRDIESDPDDPGYPQPTRDIVRRVTPENLPAVINNALSADGVLNPDWHVVANLPGNMIQGIRTMGRRIFKAFTRTPTDEIIMIANVFGMGPNTSREINAVSNWLKNNGQEVSTGNLDFGVNRPDIVQYDAAGARFLLVKEEFQGMVGQYIFMWPQTDSVDIGN